MLANSHNTKNVNTLCVRALVISEDMLRCGNQIKKIKKGWSWIDLTYVVTLRCSLLHIGLRLKFDSTSSCPVSVIHL